jgi:cell wall-associated NlpC family hydrolase
MSGKHRKRSEHRILKAILPLAGVAAVTAAVATPASASTSIVRSSASRTVASAAQRYIGDPYEYGGTGPRAFDCSGLAQYLYKTYAGVTIPRDAEDQFLYFRQETKAHAWGGDLVFFHDADGYVFHTGIYEGGNGMVSALSPEYGVKQTPLSWGEGDYVTFGTISH